jgi:4-oxalocrotonate tautomerase
MPLVRIDLRKGKSAEYRAAICDGIYEALRATFNVPEEDRFMIVNEHDESNHQFSRNYLGITRSDDLIFVQLTVSNTRSVAQKQALYAGIVERLADNPGVRREDVFISLLEVGVENWSFGNGIAPYV